MKLNLDMLEKYADNVYVEKIRKRQIDGKTLLKMIEKECEKENTITMKQARKNKYQWL